MREMIKSEWLTERIKMQREANNKSLADVAKEMGISRQAVWKMERNPLTMQLKTMMSMANAIGCDVRNFFTD